MTTNRSRVSLVPTVSCPYCYYCCHCHQLLFTITLLAAEVVGFRQPLKSEHDHIFKTDSSYMGHLDKLHMDAEH